MKVKDIVNILQGTVITEKESVHLDFEFGFASDLMSDVLTLQTENMILITGLVNVQTIRTAEMADIGCIVFARGKKASAEIIELAQENNIIVIECSFSMFRTCGLLYNSGLKPVY